MRRWLDRLRVGLPLQRSSQPALPAMLVDMPLYLTVTSGGVRLVPGEQPRSAEPCPAVPAVFGRSEGEGCA